MPLVSVVMLSYNHEKFIAESIESVLGQDFDDFELIIVDDASTDASRKIIQKYAAEDARIRVILHETNRGISKTMNDGSGIAKGKFVAIIASDDVWAKDKLTKQLAVTASNENLIVWSEGEIIDLNGQPVGKSFSEFCRSVSRKKSGDIWQEILRSNYIFGSTVLYKKRHLEDVRFDEGLLYLNDYKFFLELARQHQFHYITEPLAKYRIHGDNTLSGSGPETLKRLRIAADEYISIVEDAMRQYDDEITRETRAVIYDIMGHIFYSAGEKKKGLCHFFRAIKCDPLLYPQRALKRILDSVVRFVA